MWEVTSVGISGQKAWREGVLSLVSRGAEVNDNLAGSIYSCLCLVMGCPKHR